MASVTSKVGDHAVPHGPDGDDVARCAAQHVLGFQPHGQHPVFGTVIGPHGDHGGFAENNAFAFDVNQRVGRTQVDGQVAGKDAQNGIDESSCCLFS